MTERKDHWDAVYSQKKPTEVSWYQSHPAASLKAIGLTGIRDEPMIDVGGGASDLTMLLLRQGWGDVTVLDISEAALDVVARRLGEDAERVQRIAANITQWTPPRRYALWHDRAVFHFLTDADDRAAYLAALRRGLRAGGYAILATFAPDGPEKCSGLPVRRYSAAELAAELGSEFQLLHHWAERHDTPGGTGQAFTWTVFRRA